MNFKAVHENILEKIRFAVSKHSFYEMSTLQLLGDKKVDRKQIGNYLCLHDLESYVKSVQFQQIYSKKIEKQEKESIKKMR